MRRLFAVSPVCGVDRRNDDFSHRGSHRWPHSVTRKYSAEYTCSLAPPHVVYPKPTWDTVSDRLIVAAAATHDTPSGEAAAVHTVPARDSRRNTRGLATRKVLIWLVSRSFQFWNDSNATVPVESVQMAIN